MLAPPYKLTIRTFSLPLVAAAAIVAVTLLLNGGCGGTPDLQPEPVLPETEETTGNPPATETQDEARAADSTGEDSYLISAHDLIDITVLGESDLSLSVRVSERGTISFPLLGEVRTEGYTPIQFERRMEELLKEDYLVSPSVNITIREYGSISVLGQVQKPGTFEIKGRLTVTRAIALAGGLTDTASPNGTRIIRRHDGQEETIPVRLNDILKDGDLSHDIPLRPGDLLVVPESFF